LAFYDMVFNQLRPRAAMKLYAGDVYIQHNPGVKDGKEGLIEYFREMDRRYPGKRASFKRVIAGGHYVSLRCLQEWPSDRNWVAMDIFRLDDSGKIVEHWNVLQVAPDSSANVNGMF
jgi:predicted SnoaL-like aldol condensation-catalyzing enzyme